MSLAQVKFAIEQFVQNDKNQLLVIKGRWGVGKTYFWQNFVNDISKKAQISHKNYSYVSLFGISSLETLKNSILASQISSNAISKDANTSSSVLLSRVKNIFTYIERTPKVRTWTEGWASELAFQLVNDSLICFDDLERKSDSLKIKDVLGLANNLKEQRNCKIVIILNENSLEDETESFRQHIEKIADLELTFSPQIEEVFDYVFNENFPHNEIIKENCLRLGIQNIRILKRLRIFIENLLELSKGSETITIKEVLTSITLFVGSHYGKDIKIPSLEFIRKFSSLDLYFAREIKKEEVSKEIEEQYQTLEGYGYINSDELDEVLISYVENGYLNNDKFLKLLDEKNQISKQKENSYHDAWHLYNNSFKNNEDLFTEALAKGFKESSIYLSLDSLQISVEILRELNRSDIADQLIDYYLENEIPREVIRRFLHNSFGDARDEILLERLKSYEIKVEVRRSLAEITNKLKYSRGWNEEDVIDLDSFPEDEYYLFFKNYEGDDLYYRVKACLQFGKFSNASEQYKSVSEKAENALKKIAKESKINKIRMYRLFGISAD